MLPFSRPSGRAPEAARSLGLRHLLLFAALVVVLGAVLHFMPHALPAEAAAHSAAPAGTVAATPTLSETTTGVRLGGGYLGALALLLGGAALALYLRRTAQPEGAALMRPLGSFKIAPNQQLRLVACGEDVLLLGVTAGSITLLKTYPHDVLGASEMDVQPESGSTLPEEALGLPQEPQDGFAKALRERAVRSAMPLYRKGRTSGKTATAGLL